MPSSVSSTMAAQSHKRLDSQPVIRSKPAKIALDSSSTISKSRDAADALLETDETDSIVAILAVSER